MLPIRLSQRVGFLVAGGHIRNCDLQLPFHGVTGVVLIGFQNVQHITRGTKLLLHGIDKTGQFCFDFLPPLLDDLIRPFLFFEKDGHRQKKDHRRQDRKDQQGRYYQQPRSARL